MKSHSGYTQSVRRSLRCSAASATVLGIALFALTACDPSDQGSGGSAVSAGNAGQTGSAGQGGSAGAAGNSGRLRPILISPSLYQAVGSLGSSGGAGGAGGGGGGDTSGGAGTPSAFACTPETPSGAPPSVGVCGDGWLSPGEQCDDGNVANGDGCSSTCFVTPTLVAPHGGTGTLLPGRELGSGSHPSAVGCSSVGVSFIDHAVSPPALKLALFSGVGQAQGIVSYGTSASTSPSPSVAALPDGTFVAAWTDFDADELGVRLRKLDPAATSQKPALFANAAQDFSQRGADVVFDGNGRIVVAWVDDSDPVNGPDLRYRTFGMDLSPTSGDLTLAATSAVEDHITLAAFHGSWAAAWRSGSGGSERIEVQSGSSHWTVGPFLPGGTEDRPALAFVDPNHLALAFTEGTDPSATGVANVPRLHATVLDTSYPGQTESFEVKPTVEPYASSIWLSQTEPAIATYDDRLVVAWRSASVTGDPVGDELWTREIKWSAGTSNTVLLDTSAPERLLLTGGDLRAGDQARPVLLSSSNWPDHRLMSVWEEDSHRVLDNSSSLPDVLVQFSQVPGELPSPAPGPCGTVTLSVSPPGPAVGSTSVTLTAAATCGNGAEAEYMFGYQDPSQTTWTEIRGYASSPTTTWNTAGLPSGNYVLYAYARRKGTSVSFDSNAGLAYLVGNVCYANASMTVSPGGVQPIGTVLSLSANATCLGIGATPEYRALYWPPGSSTWSYISDWSTTPVSWNTAGLPSGSYTLLTAIREHGNASGQELTAYGGALLGNVCYAVNSVVSSPPSPQGIGATVALSATATCVGATTPEFLYYYYAPGSGSPVQIGTWSSSPVSWNTTGLPSGSYSLLVYARGAGNGSAGGESYLYAPFQLGELCPSVTESASPASPQSTGTSVTFSAVAGCASADYSFYYRLWGESAWVQFRGWASAATATWNTSSLASGLYEIRVDARIAGHSATETNTQISYLIGDVCPSTTISASPVSPHAVGTTVSLSASSSCTSGATPEYEFFYRGPGATSLTLIRGWGGATADWNTVSLPAGGYSVFSMVRARGNTDMYDSEGESSYVLQ